MWRIIEATAVLSCWQDNGSFIVTRRRIGRNEGKKRGLGKFH